MITLDEIACAAGVTKVTVSRILTGSYIAKRPDAIARAKAIRELAQHMGYRPNHSARAIRTGRTGCIGMLVSPNLGRSIHDPAFEYAIIDALSERDMNLIKDIIQGPTEQGQVITPRLIAQHLTDGLIINHVCDIDPASQRMLDCSEMPVVWANAKREHHCIYPDDIRAGGIATRRLIELGHRRIAFASPQLYEIDQLKNGHYSEADRHTGYQMAMHEAGLTPMALRPAVLHHEEYNGHATRRLSKFLRGVRPTALVANCFPGVAMHGALAAGMCVPDDLSLIAFCNSVGTEDAHTACMPVPFQKLGHRCVQYLVDQIERVDPSCDPIAIPYDLMDGPSLQPLP